MDKIFDVIKTIAGPKPTNDEVITATATVIGAAVGVLVCAGAALLAVKEAVDGNKPATK